MASEQGQDTIEFALLGSLVSIVAVLSLQAFGPLLSQLYLAVRFALMTIRTVVF